MLPMILACAMQQPVPDPKPVVTPMPNVQVIRNGSPVVTVPGVSITLQDGDVITTAGAEYPAQLTLTPDSFFALMPSTSLKYARSSELDEPDYELTSGQLIYTSFPQTFTRVDPMLLAQVGPPVGAASGRKRLVRASQRTLGTDGTSFSLTLRTTGGKPSLSVMVFHGTVRLFDAKGVLEKELEANEFVTIDPSK